MDRITIKPDVCGGEPTIRGMRITVSHVLEMLAGGMTPEQVLQDFPYLEKADIDAFQKDKLSAEDFRKKVTTIVY